MRPPRGEQASLQIFVTMFREEVKIYRDVSGTSLHRRGYRRVVHKAALNEAAAAGLLYIAGWPELAIQGTRLPFAPSHVLYLFANITHALQHETST